MKKFIFKTAMIVAVCLCWYGNRMNRTPKMDNLLLMNVEALSLDEYWDYKTGEFYPDYDIGVARYPVAELHYPYDWKNIVPAPSGTRFKAYLTSHSKEADELLLNVRRLER